MTQEALVLEGVVLVLGEEGFVGVLVGVFVDWGVGGAGCMMVWGVGGGLLLDALI